MFFFKKKYESIASSEMNLKTQELIDVRTKSEYQSAHIPKSIHIEMERLLESPEKFLKKEQGYYIICASGMRSARVCKHLSKLGYTVTNVKGGTMSYKGKLV